MSTPTDPEVSRSVESSPSGAPTEVLQFSFYGQGRSLFALMLRNILLTLVTCGIYVPWAKTSRRQYIWQNIEVQGHRLRYHGTGQELFIGYLKVVFGYLVFLGLPPLVKRLTGSAAASLTVQFTLVLLLVPLIPLAIWGSQRYLLSRTSWRGIRFRLEGSPAPYIKTFLGGYLLSIVTLGLYAPVWLNNLRRLMINATSLGTCSFEYRGEDRVVFWMGVKGFLLSLVTFGIYGFWYHARLIRYELANTWFSGAHAETSITGRELFGLTLLQVFGITLTLGLAFPWIAVYSLEFVLKRTRMVGPIDLAAIQRAPALGNAVADGLADVLDVGTML